MQVIRVVATQGGILIDGRDDTFVAGTLEAALDTTGTIVTITNTLPGTPIAFCDFSAGVIADGAGNVYATPAEAMAYLARALSGRGTSRVETADPIVITALDHGAMIGVRKAVPSPTAIPLPDDADEGFRVTIKDMAGDAATNPITLTSTLAIDGAPEAVMSNNWQSQTLYRNDLGWSLL